MIAPDLATRTDVLLVDRVVASQDPDGNDVFTTTETSVAGCAFQPGTSSEDVTARDRADAMALLWCPLGTAVGSADAVKISGVRYEVVGPPRQWDGFGDGHIEVTLKRTTG